MGGEYVAQPERRLRADAARNRARVLEVAYETFAAEGLSVPIDEIVSEQRMVMLPGLQGNVGEQYGREFEKPLVTRVAGHR